MTSSRVLVIAYMFDGWLLFLLYLFLNVLAATGVQREVLKFLKYKKLINEL